MKTCETTQAPHDPNAPTVDQITSRWVRDKYRGTGEVARHTLIGRAMRQATTLAETLQELEAQCRRICGRPYPPIDDPNTGGAADTALDAMHLRWMVEMTVHVLGGEYVRDLDAYRPRRFLVA